MVMAGVVLVNEQRVDKSSDQFTSDAQIRVKHAEDPASRYVGRGGLKLEAALREFQIDVRGAVCLDAFGCRDVRRRAPAFRYGSASLDEP